MKLRILLAYSQGSIYPKDTLVLPSQNISNAFRFSKRLVEHILPCKC